MERIYPGQEVLSLFGIANKAQALNKKIASQGLFGSLISAFFVVLLAGLILGILSRVLISPASSAVTLSVAEEKVAFQPGQFISQEIKQGYLGQ